MSETTIVLYGSGSPLLVEYEEICKLNGIVIAGIIDNLSLAIKHSVINTPLISLAKIHQLDSNLFVCPLFTPFNRFQATTEAISLGFIPLDMLTTTSNLLPSDFTNGKGCFINRGVICGAASSIGNHVLINRGANLGHHLMAEDFVSIGPGVVTGGNVTVKRGAQIGTGAVILPTITIGRHAIVGAGSVVTKDVADHAVMVGNPARKIRDTERSF